MVKPAHIHITSTPHKMNENVLKMNAVSDAFATEENIISPNAATVPANLLGTPET
jgi:protocatechuate 3,4-dioxygenase beta subunit